METRLTLRPGQPGTKKLLARYGDRLVCVRYLYDTASGQRLKTVELVVDSVKWRPKERKPRMRPTDLVGVRVQYNEMDVRRAIKLAGGIWRPRQRLWEVTWECRAHAGATRTDCQRVSLPVRGRTIYPHMGPYAGRCLHLHMDGNSIGEFLPISSWAS